MHIRDYDNLRQAVDFSGLEFGAKRPTDIDMSFEEDKKLFAFSELKFGQCAAAFRHDRKYLGQRLALTRLIDAIRDEYGAALFVASHTTPAPQLIPAVTSRVVDIYYKGDWLKLLEKDKDLTLRTWLERFRTKFLKG